MDHHPSTGLRSGALFLLLVLVATTHFACAAYNKAAYAALDQADVITGSFDVVNTMSVPVCAVTMVHEGEPDRTGNDMHGKFLAAGGESRVGFPLVGKASEDLPQPEVWTMQVYGCRETAFDHEVGVLLTTIEGIGSESTSVAIR